MKLAQIVKIIDIHPIEGADKIEAVSVLGYKVVARKGVCEIGDLAVYIVPDTEVPKQKWSDFLFKGDQKDREKIRLRVAKLRGQVSQGLLIPLSQLNIQNPVEGMDITENLGVTKYSKPVPACLSGEVFGYMPGFLYKTDEDNLRNNPDCLGELQGLPCYISQKVDGSSATYFIKDGEFGVCSRNMQLKPSNNTFWEMAKKYSIEEGLRNLFGGQNIAIQGEVFGEGIQKNHLGVVGHHLEVFDLWDIDKHEHLGYKELSDACYRMQIPMVNVIWSGIFNFSLNEIIEMANSQKYQSGSPAEGIVVRPLKTTFSQVLGGRLSVKIISEKFALKHGE